MKKDWLGQLFATGLNVPLTNTLTATAIAALSQNLPANFVEANNDILMVEAAGVISTLTASPGTLTLSLRMDATIIASTGAMALNTTAKTAVPWYLRAYLTFGPPGASTATTPSGIWVSEASVGAPTPSTGGAAPLPFATTGSTFDATTEHLFALYAQWSVNNAANSIQAGQFRAA